ncbi:hypothetical protein GCM10010124_01760 [Pilimelia terevasa]|uniref:Uncharacterized protein n=1 Tax=Pilimelia terevasa TaxID=53372 RepID=A0A8J3BD43_9ACTN|nr:hypothetical protein GCM10010124_01760 [Pilimelia terevasa]
MDGGARPAGAAAGDGGGEGVDTPKENGCWPPVEPVASTGARYPSAAALWSTTYPPPSRWDWGGDPHPAGPSGASTLLAAPDGRDPGRVLPHRVPVDAEPLSARAPAPPAQTPELARLATHLRRDDEPGAPRERPEGFDVDAVLGAAHDVSGVRGASLRTTPSGAHLLRLDLADGADAAHVSREVARMLQERLGLAAGPASGAPRVPRQAEPDRRPAHAAGEPPRPSRRGRRRAPDDTASWGPPAPARAPRPRGARSAADADLPAPPPAAASPTDLAAAPSAAALPAAPPSSAPSAATAPSAAPPADAPSAALPSAGPSGADCPEVLPAAERREVPPAAGRSDVTPGPGGPVDPPAAGCGVPVPGVGPATPAVAPAAGAGPAAAAPSAASGEAPADLVSAGPAPIAEPHHPAPVAAPHHPAPAPHHPAPAQPPPHDVGAPGDSHPAGRPVGPASDGAVPVGSAVERPGVGAARVPPAAGTLDPAGATLAAAAPADAPAPAGGPVPAGGPFVAPPAAARVRIGHVGLAVAGLDATVEVRLAAGGRSARGTASGPAVERYLPRLCAAAAAAAIGDLVGAADGRQGRCFVEHAAVVPLGSCEVAVVVVLLVCDGWVEQLAGSAIVTDDAHQATVRATMAAVNRLLDALL